MNLILSAELEIAVNIYNNNHSTTGFTPFFIFTCNDKKIYDIVQTKTINNKNIKKVILIIL